MKIFDELKRRNVFRVGIAYAVATWLLLQLSDILVPLLKLPESAQRFVLLLLVIGFIPALIIAWAFEMTPDGLKKEKDVDRSQSITTQTGRKLDRAIIGILVLALAWFMWDKFTQPSSAPETALGTQTAEAAREATETVQPEAAPAKSIAVLPFTNMSEDASNEFFSDGISEEILNALVKVRELKVAGRTSSFAFKGRNEDLRVIGEALGVSHILEGSVRKAGNKVRITAQLIKVDDGFHLWSDTYDRELTDIFAIQDEIANAILVQLKTQLIGGSQITSTRADTRAYEKYLLAKQRIYNRALLEMESALVLLGEAIELDEYFAPAWAQRGIVTLLLSEQNYGTIPREEALESAKGFLQRSLQLDEDLAEGLAGMGLYYRDLPGSTGSEQAIDHLRRALEINPSLVDASNWLANQLAETGRFREAFEIQLAMNQRDPLYRPAMGNTIGSYLRMGQPDKARQVLDRVKPYFPDDAGLTGLEANILFGSGQFGAAYPLAKVAHEQFPQNINVAQTMAFSIFGTNQIEKLIDFDERLVLFKLWALYYLGRVEEGMLLAQQEAERDGDPSNLVWFLDRTGRAKEAVAYLDEHWPDLTQFDAKYGNSFGFGYPAMLAIARVYQQVGRNEKFEKAMGIVRKTYDSDARNGADNIFLQSNEAAYWALSGDFERALDYLEKAVDNGWSSTPRLARLMPAFKPLEGMPRYEALQARALEHLNEQRALLDLEPLVLDRTI